MKLLFSKSWQGSSQRRKQRKYVHNLPLHLRTSHLAAHLHKSLQEKYGLRSIPLRKGDKVKVMRGSFAGTESLVERVDRKELRIVLEKMRTTRRDGSEVPVRIAVSNVLIVALNQDDPRRFTQQKQAQKSESKPTPPTQQKASFKKK